VPMAGPRPLGSRRSATACLPGSDIALASADAHGPARPWCRFGRTGRSGRPASAGARRARRSKGLSVSSRSRWPVALAGAVSACDGSAAPSTRRSSVATKTLGALANPLIQTP
jgi:hypothetical protein